MTEQPAQGNGVIDMVPDILKPDLKALVWLALGYFVLGKILKTVGI